MNTNRIASYVLFAATALFVVGAAVEFSQDNVSSFFCLFAVAFVLGLIGYHYLRLAKGQEMQQRQEEEIALAEEKKRNLDEEQERQYKEALEARAELGLSPNETLVELHEKDDSSRSPFLKENTEREVDRSESIAAKKNKAIDTVTVIDFETANRSYTSACSIGIAVIKGNEIVDRQYYLIQPPQNFYTNENIAIHHITPADTANADTFPTVWEKIKHLFENTYLAAHNAIFDMSVLKATINYYNLEQPHFEYVNTIAVSGYAIPTGVGVNKSLDARCEYFGITLENHHNALADAVAAAQLILCNLAKSRYKSAVSFLRCNSSYLKNYDDVKLKATASFQRFNNVAVNEIAASTTVNEEKDADFDGKTFVITGEFRTMSREQALAVVVERGGMIKSGVSSKVDILVNADGRVSTKTKKAAELQAAGHHIKIINEDQFMRMLESNDAIDLDC